MLQYIEDENNKIIAHKKYIIKEEADYVEKDGIVDLQRFPVNSGKYMLFIEITDITNHQILKNTNKNLLLIIQNFPVFLTLSYWIVTGKQMKKAN